MSIPAPFELWRCKTCPEIIPGAGFDVYLRIREHEDEHEDKTWPLPTAPAVNPRQTTLAVKPVSKPSPAT